MSSIRRQTGPRNRILRSKRVQIAPEEQLVDFLLCLWCETQLLARGVCLCVGARHLPKRRRVTPAKSSACHPAKAPACRTYQCGGVPHLPKPRLTAPANASACPTSTLGPPHPTPARSGRAPVRCPSSYAVKEAPAGTIRQQQRHPAGDDQTDGQLDAREEPAT